ncbi:glycosyltransferase [Engelhardtia mirabilis]|uniref:glycosyltransferase n=1 Tax=Engelhardtia mirabilis TaxID=2528011 RepID=UPI003AF36F3B
MALVLHGYPPEQVGGTELSVRTLAHNLVAEGLEVVVIAGTLDWSPGFATTTSIDEGASRPITVYKLHRGDLYFDHWQKGREPRVSRAFAEILRSERPDVVHVHHWVRLSNDLVAVAARCGIPAVVTLQDLWSTCLLTFRVRPDTRSFCEAEMAPDPCLDCASVLRPRTPWMSRAQAEARFGERTAFLRRELDLARIRIAACGSHAQTVRQFLGVSDVEIDLLPPGVDVQLARRAPRALPGEGEPLRIGAWGHLAPLKGADVLIEALRLLPNPNAVRLELAGGEVDPAFAAHLRERSEGLDVHFHSAYELAELDRNSVSDVHLMATGTRAHESWGLVLDEALLMGLPSLLPAAGALLDRAQGRGFAALYRQGDPADLARVIGELLADPARIEAMRAAIPAPDDCRLTGVDHARLTVTLYQRAITAGAPAVEPVDEADEQRAIEFQDAWDEGLKAASAVELGFEEEPS